jgi:hypothetical protein
VAHWNGAEPRHRVTDSEAPERKCAWKPRSFPSSRTPNSEQYSVSDGSTALGIVELISGAFIAVYSSDEIIGAFDTLIAAALFLQNHKAASGGHQRTGCRVVCSIALQYGVPLDVILKALMHDSRGRASGPSGTAPDFIAEAVP